MILSSVANAEERFTLEGAGVYVGTGGSSDAGLGAMLSTVDTFCLGWACGGAQVCNRTGQRQFDLRMRAQG